MSKIARKPVAFRPAGQFEVTLGSASEAFRLRCQAQNLSLGTIGCYKQLLKMFAAFLEEQGVTAVRGVTPTLLLQYLEHMRERGNGSVTIERAYGGLHCFFGFMARERMIPQNPIQLVEKPRVGCHRRCLSPGFLLKKIPRNRRSAMPRHKDLLFSHAARRYNSGFWL